MQDQRSPFQRLSDLLAGQEPKLKAPDSPINLTLGEPRHAMPSFISGIIEAHAGDFRRYPPIRGTEDFRQAVADWLDRRYDLKGAISPDDGILPLNGTREGLFHAAIGARDWAAVNWGKRPDHPAILLPNPFYHAYAAGAHAIGAEAVYLGGVAETDFLPDLDALAEDTALLDRTIAFYFASPTNPQGTMADRVMWQKLVALARKHNFMILADECYSELYRSAPPVGILEAARIEESHMDVRNIVTFHSLSKRSNLAGLRCGFAAGDPAFLTHWTKYRNMAAPQVPLPLLAAATAAYRDEEHVAKNRHLYNQKYASAAQILGSRFGYSEPPAGFFVWLDVSAHGDDVAVAQTLWKDVGVRVIPGSYLARDDRSGGNPGSGYIRLAMVAEQKDTDEALKRLCDCLAA